MPRDDLYKSGTIHTGPGEPPGSRSKPTPKSKRVPGKPITNGKLLRPGGPAGGPSKVALRPAATRPVPQQPPRAQRTVPTQPRPVPQPVAVINGIGHMRQESSSSINREPPPPPPPPPATHPQVKKDIFRVLYDFGGQSHSEMSIHKDELLEIIRKEDNGTTPFSQHNYSKHSIY